MTFVKGVPTAKEMKKEKSWRERLLKGHRNNRGSAQAA